VVREGDPIIQIMPKWGLPMAPQPRRSHQRRTPFDRFHADCRAKALHAGQAAEIAAQQTVQRFDVAGDDMQQIITVARRRVAREDGGMVHDGGFESGMLGELDRNLDKGAELEANGIGIDGSGIARNDALLFQ
jgi:hypothetical protein